MFVILQILFVVFLIAAAVFYFIRIKKRKAPVIIAICVLTAVSGLISANILSCIPLPTDQITLTAAGKKNENSLNNEVALSSLIVDGKTYEIDSIDSGKWFYKGTDYMWRNENDSRKPEGITRSVTLNIPAGAGRALVFNNNQYRGIVEITYNGETKTYDLYRENNEATKISIPSSDNTYIIKIGRLALFALFIIILMAYPVFAAIKFEYAVISGWFGRNWDKVFYICLSFVFVAAMFEVNKSGIFWLDEIWNIGWIVTDAPMNDMGIPNSTGLSFNYSSLYGLICSAWYYIMPYGEEYLLLLSGLLCGGAIYVAGLIGSMLRNKSLGVIFACVTAFSTWLNYCANEFRMYALLIFLIYMVMYFFIKKMRSCDNEKKPVILLYGLFITAAMDTHAFGIVFCGFLMITDFLYMIIKKADKKCWLEFLLPAIYAIYWFISYAQGSLTAVGGYNSERWAGKTSPQKSYEIIYSMCSGNIFLLLAFVFGVSFFIYDLIKKIKEKNFDCKTDYINAIFLILPISVFVFNYIYSTVNSQNTLFIDRYFTVIVPSVFLWVSYGIDDAFNFLSEGHSNSAKISLVSAAMTVLCVTGLYNLNVGNNRENWIGAADALSNSNDIYLDTTLVLFSGNEYLDAGMSYYTTAGGKRDEINHFPLESMASILLDDYSTIYVTYIHSSISYWENILIENGFVPADDNTGIKLKKYVNPNNKA